MSLNEVPPEVPLDIATALMLQGCTAHYLSHSAFALGPVRSCLRGRAADLFSYYASGRLKVAIDREFRLAQAADAHRYLEGRNTKGKLLLGI